MHRDSTCTRRGFLRSTGLAAAGLTLAATALPRFATPAFGKETYEKWPFAKLDAGEVSRIAYENYMDLWCASTVLKGIFAPLAASVGGPYGSFPVESMKWAHGGLAGWGTVCGTMTGAATAIGFITGNTATAEAMANDLMFYYADTVLPTYTPAQAKWATIRNKTQAGTPMCHISVGRWMEKEGVHFLSGERAERCARVAGSIAGRTAEMLNAWSAAGNAYTPVHRPLDNVLTNGITAQTNCTDCHGSAVPEPPTEAKAVH